MKIKGGALDGRPSGAQKPRKWEQLEEGTKWCGTCHDYTEQDRLGCVECYDPARDRIEELDDPDASQFAPERERGD